VKRDIPGYKKKLGALGEKIAGEYLQEVEGYRIIARNYTCPFGEIDIVAADKKTTVFVEVRSVSLSFAGFAEESIGFRKQKKLRQLASYYLKEKGLNGCLSRFDVMILLFDQENSVVKEIKHIKNAF
jgi:putative endonuclease